MVVANGVAWRGMVKVVMSKKNKKKPYSEAINIFIKKSQKHRHNNKTLPP